MLSEGIGRPSHLRSLNHRALVRAIRDHGPISRSDLARRLGMSKVTVSSIVTDLLGDAVVREAGTASQGIGRSATLLDLHPSIGVLAAADMDSETIRLRLSDMRGTRIRQAKHNMPDSLGELLSLIADGLAGLAEDSDTSLSQILHLKIAVPAAVEPNGNISFASSPKYIEGKGTFRQLQKLLPGGLVSLVNDVNAASIGEGRCGAARGWSKYAYLGVRKSGIGMGLVLNDRLYLGAHGRAGEIGLLRPRGEPWPLDAVSSEQAPEALNELAKVVATTFALLDLEGIVLHTRLKEGVDWFEELERHLQAMVPYTVELTEGRLGDDGPLVGATMLALDQTWKKLESVVRSATNSRRRS